MHTNRTSSIVTIALASALAIGAAAPHAARAASSQTRTDRARAARHYEDGWKRYRSEAWEEAAREFTRAIELDENYELAYYGLGRTYMALKRYVEAIGAYQQARALFLSSVSDNFNNQQAMRQRWQDQLRELDELIRQTQQGNQNAQTINQARQLRDQQQRIRQNMDRASGVALDTTVPAFISLSLGSAYFRAERLPDAEREYKATLDADPKSGEAWNNLAVIYMLTGRLSEAEQAIAAAEHAGYPVSPGLKAEIEKRKR